MCRLARVEGGLGAEQDLEGRFVLGKGDKVVERRPCSRSELRWFQFPQASPLVDIWLDSVVEVGAL